MPLLRIVAGDVVSIPITLTQNNSTFVINSSATIKAALVTRDSDSRLTLAGRASDMIISPP